ncbi:MAG: hypothetical protein EPN72_14910 [Nevskiaceae bacterium]|nr:MAG: hypothetical protein EPN72_14910 [Nevskiaceae bacterium]TBR76193.1 MAG: hypothetical protein EPN64_08840 [Burkholderiaceae bacterium]
MPAITTATQWLAPNFANIPAALRTLPWAVWKAVPRKEPGKFGKPPSNPSTGRKIGTNKPDTWGTYEEAKRAYEAGDWDGVGVLLTAGSGIVGIDVDDAETTFKTQPQAQEILKAYKRSGGFVEISPSGTGVHGYVMGTLPPGRRKAGSLEIYDDVRFLTVTGGGTGELKPDPVFISDFHGLLSHEEKPAATVQPGLTVADSAVVQQLEATVKAAEPALWEGRWAGSYPSQSEADQALCSKIANHAKTAGVAAADIHATLEAVFSLSKLGERKKWQEREDYRRRTVGKAVDDYASEAAESEATPAQVGALAEFGSRYFVAPLGSQVLVFDRRAEDIVGSAMRPTAFHHLHANKFASGDNVSRKWFASKSRETLDSVVFDPEGRAKPDVFNLWRGLPLVPKAGTCGRILSHVKFVWCSGDRLQFRYVLKWLALLVQIPWRKPEVALILRSIEGTGKTIITNVLLEIFGRYGFTAAQTSQVAGNFNGHLMDKVLVVLEEAVFAGDMKADSIAKVLISNSHMAYEWKGKDVIQGRSYHHVLILSNRTWAVPAGPDARRYAVLDVSAHRKGDWEYFKALSAQIEAGGAAAFLYFLLKLDISNFNPRDLPQTSGMRQQRAETIMRSDPVQAWWLSVLADGEFPVEDGAIPWGVSISSHEIQDSFKVSTRGGRNVPPWPVAVKQLKKLLPAGALTKTRPRVAGNLGSTRQQEYSLPLLTDARAEFEKTTGVNPTA